MKGTRRVAAQIPATRPAALGFARIVRAAGTSSGARSAGLYAWMAVVSLLATYSLLGLWGVDLHYPLVSPHGDYLSGAMLVKSVLVNGSNLNIPQVGAPHGLQYHDYPVADGLHIAAFYLMSFFTQDAALAINIYYILGYVLISLSTLFVMRQLGLPFVPSMGAAVLFAFLPHHYARSETHLFLSSYFMVPLMCLTLVWVAQGQVFVRRDPAAPPFRYRLTPKGKGACVICLIMGIAGIYYAAFGVMLLLCAGVYAALRGSRWRATVPALALAAVIAGGVVLNLAPNIAYRLRHGTNAAVAARSWVEAEVYSLRIGALLLPIPGHRIATLRDRTLEYLQGGGAAMRVRDGNIALGAVGAAGFLILVAWVIWGRAHRQPYEVLDALSALNLFAVLIATAGGFAGLSALFFGTKIRAYNRICVYIAFFSFTAVAVVLQNIERRWFASKRTAFYAVVAVFMAAGLWDITPPVQMNYGAIRDEYDDTRAFVRQVEETVPHGSMIFQLPYHPFPEAGPAHKMIDYEHFKGFLHSDTVRWSYGAMKGRPADEWQKRVANKAAPEMLQDLVYAGFAGIYIDRTGYPDNAAALASQLSALVGTPPREDQAKTLLFFPIGKYAAAVKAAAGATWEQRRTQASALPLTVIVGGGCSRTERKGDVTWNWCQSDGEIFLENGGTAGRMLRLAGEFRSAADEYPRLTVSGLLSESRRIRRTPTPFSWDVLVPPGKHSIKLHCDGKRLVSPDPRIIVFGLMNVRTTEP